MSAVSFTGIGRKLSRAELAIVRQHVPSLHGVGLFNSGAAAGVDIEAAAVAIEAFPEAKHQIYIPTFSRGDCRYDIAGVERLRELAEAHEAAISVARVTPDGPTPAVGYLRRDDVLAAVCSHMVAFPETGKERKRSGTWATIRRGRGLGVPVKIIPLDGSEPWVVRPA